MSASHSARARVRVELTREITDAARHQLALVGPAGLSLRAVARSLDMVPSALYRYFASRDHLLTALIIDAYRAIAEAAEASDASQPNPDWAGRWMAAATGMRRWALDHPNEWALVYGSPVPGYRAPQDTIEPALRVARALTAPFADATRNRRLHPVATVPPVPAAVVAALLPVDQALLDGAPPEVAPLVLMAITQVVGAINLELFGHFEGAVLDPEAVFRHAVVTMGALAGLPTPTT